LNLIKSFILKVTHAAWIGKVRSPHKGYG